MEPHARELFECGEGGTAAGVAAATEVSDSTAQRVDVAGEGGRTGHLCPAGRQGRECRRPRPTPAGGPCATLARASVPICPDAPERLCRSTRRVLAIPDQRLGA